MLNFLLRKYHLHLIHDRVTFHARGSSTAIDYIFYSDNIFSVNTEIELTPAQSGHIALFSTFSVPATSAKLKAHLPRKKALTGKIFDLRVQAAREYILRKMSQRNE